VQSVRENLISSSADSFSQWELIRSHLFTQLRTH
jgi:hypothetical protein